VSFIESRQKPAREVCSANRTEVQVAKAPASRYYVVNAFGDYIFIKVRGRAKAQEIIDEIYGKDFYKIRFMGLAPITGKEISARP